MAPVISMRFKKNPILNSATTVSGKQYILPKHTSTTAEAKMLMVAMLEWSAGMSEDARRIAALTKCRVSQTNSGVYLSEGHSGHLEMV